MNQPTRTIKRSLLVEARLWFDKTYGNTYHSVRIWVDGEIVGATGKFYGYGDQYRYTAFQWLAMNGYPDYANSHLWPRFDTVGFDTYFTVSEVKKRELFNAVNHLDWIDERNAERAAATTSHNESN